MADAGMLLVICGVLVLCVCALHSGIDWILNHWPRWGS